MFIFCKIQLGNHKVQFLSLKKDYFSINPHVEVVICGVFGGVYIFISKKRGEFIFAFIAPGSLRVLTCFTSLELFYNITNLISSKICQMFERISTRFFIHLPKCQSFSLQIIQRAQPSPYGILHLRIVLNIIKHHFVSRSLSHHSIPHIKTYNRFTRGFTVN